MNVKVEKHVEISAAVGQPTNLTGTDLYSMVSEVKLTKDNAVRLIALDSALKKILPKAKNYLKELKSFSTGSFTDSQTGLSITVETVNQKPQVTNDEIEALQEEIETLRQLVLENQMAGTVKHKQYTRWKLVK